MTYLVFLPFCPSQQFIPLNYLRPFAPVLHLLLFSLFRLQSILILVLIVRGSRVSTESHPWDVLEIEQRGTQSSKKKDDFQ